MHLGHKDLTSSAKGSISPPAVALTFLCTQSHANRSSWGCLNLRWQCYVWKGTKTIWDWMFSVTMSAISLCVHQVRVILLLLWLWDWALVLTANFRNWLAKTWCACNFETWLVNIDNTYWRAPAVNVITIVYVFHYSAVYFQFLNWLGAKLLMLSYNLSCWVTICLGRPRREQEEKRRGSGRWPL